MAVRHRGGHRRGERAGGRREQEAVDRAWLDDSGTFLFGEHRGEGAEEVATIDPEYIRWVVEEVENVSEEDREVLSAYLTWRGRGQGQGRGARDAG